MITVYSCHFIFSCICLLLCHYMNKPKVVSSISFHFVLIYFDVLVSVWQVWMERKNQKKKISWIKPGKNVLDLWWCQEQLTVLLAVETRMLEVIPLQILQVLVQVRIFTETTENDLFFFFFMELLDYHFQIMWNPCMHVILSTA